jgi:hypothetical protein
VTLTTADGRSDFARPAAVPEWRGPALFYVVCVAALFRFYQYDFGPDAISYMTIARHYSLGRWAEAVNVSWSPAFSWLLAPMLALGIPAWHGARIVCCLSGLLALYATALLAERFGINGKLRAATLYVAAAMIVGFALLRNGPDLLLAAILLFYFLIVFDPDYPLARRAGLWCGALGAAAYLTKAYGFYFFLLNFALLNGLHWRRSGAASRSRVLRHFAAGLAAFFILSAPWIAIVSARSGKPTLGSTGSWNYRLIGPESPGYPQYFNLVPPPRAHAVSMWEEQSPDLLPPWNPLASLHSIKHQLAVISGNLKELRSILLDTSPLSFAILLCYIAGSLAGSARTRVWWLYPVLTIATYLCGYLVVIVQDRYIWSLLLILFLLGASLVEQWNVSLPSAARGVLIAGFCLSFAFLPLSMLVSYRNAGLPIYRLAESTRARYSLQGRLASCGEWNDSDSFAFYLGLPYYGSTAATADEQGFSRMLNPSLRASPADAQRLGTANNELAENRIDYYLDWASCRALPDSVQASPEITGGSLPGLKIYRLRNP